MQCHLVGKSSERLLIGTTFLESICDFSLSSPFLYLILLPDLNGPNNNWILYVPYVRLNLGLWLIRHFEKTMQNESEHLPTIFPKGKLKIHLYVFFYSTAICQFQGRTYFEGERNTVYSSSGVCVLYECKVRKLFTGHSEFFIM